MIAQGADGIGATPSSALGHALGNHRNRMVQTDAHGIRRALQLMIAGFALHIRAKAADTGENRLPGFRMFADQAGQIDQFLGHFQIQLSDADIGRQTGPFRLLAFLVAFDRLSQLNIQTIRALAQGQGHAAVGVIAQGNGSGGELFVRIARRHFAHGAGIVTFGIGIAAQEKTVAPAAQIQCALFAGRTNTVLAAVGIEMGCEQIVDLVQNLAHTQFSRAVHGGGEILPEIPQHHLPIHIAGGNRVQAAFQIGGKVVFHITMEITFQKGRDQAALVFREEAFAVQNHIIAVLQNSQDGGVGGRPANAQFLELLDQGGFGITGWRLGEMLFGPDLFVCEAFALGNLGQAAVFVAILLFVAAFFVQFQKAGEIHHRPRGPQIGGAILGGDFNGRPRQTGGFHLRGRGPLPDQIVKTLLLGIEIDRHIPGQAGKIRRPDRFMGFLGILGLAAVGARLSRHVFRAEFLSDDVAGGGDRLGRHLHAVGPHIGDHTHRFAIDVETLVQALGNLHGAPGAKTQFAGGLLLQGGGGEGGRWIAPGRLGLDPGDGKIAGLQGNLRGLRRRRVGDRKAVKLDAVQMGQPADQCRIGGGLEVNLDGPVFAGIKRLDLDLPLADQAQGNGLHAAGGFRAGQLAP